MGVIPGVVDISKKTVPNPPTGLTTTDVGTSRAYDNGAANVAYTEPTYTGRLPITQYNFTGSPGGTATDTDGSPVTITGLDTSPSGTSHTFTATATNAIGNSSASSASAGVTITSVPQIIFSTVTPTRISDSSVSLSFTAGNNGGKTITGYSIVVTPTVPGGVTYDQNDATSPITVTGGYETNAPSAPTSVSATRINNTTVDVNFTPGSVTGKTYTFTIGAVNANGTGATRAPTIAPNTSGVTSYTIEGRRSDTLASISLTRVDSADLTSPIRVTGSFLGTGVPGAPTIGTPIVTGADAVDVYFTPPTNTGGVGYQFRIRGDSATTTGTFSGYTTAITPNPGTITGYSIQSNPSITLTYSGSDTTSPVGVTGGFATNTTYTFRVAAINADGTGTYSSYSTSVTPDPRKLCTSAQITVGCCTATTTCGFFGAGTNCTTVTGTFNEGAC